jgi:hypothetical protein
MFQFSFNGVPFPFPPQQQPQQPPPPPPQQHPEVKRFQADKIEDAEFEEIQK